MGASALDKDSRPNPSGADSLLLPASDGVRMPARMITEARERVLGGWCQGAVARDASGRAVAAWSSHACQWSLLGSLLASRNGGRLSELADAVGSLHSSIGESALEVWNDRPWRTQQEVVAAFDRAMDTTAGGEEESPSADGDLSAYWLSTCEGFAVDSNDGRVGIVEEVRLSPSREPLALAVRTGLFRLRLLVVSVEDVQEVVPRKKRVVLRPATC